MNRFWKFLSEDGYLVLTVLTLFVFFIGVAMDVKAKSEAQTQCIALFKDRSSEDILKLCGAPRR